MIIVSPDIAINGDGGGWCTDWFNTNTTQTRGVRDWETFHIDELLPWIDHNLRTRASRSGRAVAGLSQGGFCSISYPARYPDLFGIAVAYSGAPDIAYDPLAIGPSTSIINYTETVFDHVPANSMFGPRATEEVNWANHDPATLAANLRNTKLFLYAGNGQPGPLGGPGCASGFAQGIESLVGQDTTAFHNRLVALGIPSVYNAYGPGTHCFAYWARDLKQNIRPIAYDFAHPSPPPRKVTYTIADPTYAIYGWHVAIHRTAAEFKHAQERGRPRLRAGRQRLGHRHHAAALLRASQLPGDPARTQSPPDDPYQSTSGPSLADRRAARAGQPLPAVHGRGGCRQHGGVHDARRD